MHQPTGSGASPAFARILVGYQNALDRALTALGSGPAIQRRVLFGTDPADAILEIARGGVDLLVLGSRPVLVTPRVGETAG